MRATLVLILGIIIGGAGAILYSGSQLPAEGTAESRILKLENELRETRMRLAKIDPEQARPREDTGGALRAGMRSVFDDLKAGRPVDLNRLFLATKPIIRDLSPIFNNIRRRDERRRNEYLAGEFTRKYDLKPEDQDALRKWLADRSVRNEAAFNDLVQADSTRLDDIIRSMKDVRRDDGLDEFMETRLSGETLDAFRKQRLSERAERVQNEADWKVERLNNIAGLDEDQKDRVFSIMARTSRDFDPRMEIEGVSASDTATASGRDAAIDAVLRPDQRERYSAWRAERFERANQEAAELGLKLPDGWDVLTAD